MNIFFQNLVFAWVAFNMNAVVWAENENSAKRFVVVSDKTVASELYPLPTVLRSDPDTDEDAKKRICDDILNTYELARYDEYPYENVSVSCFHRLLLKEKEKNYSAKVIPSVAVNERMMDVDEPAFVCLARKLFPPCIMLDEYYVSSEYRLHAKPGDPTAGYLGVRFVFKYQSYRKGIIRLDRIAETPAEVFQFSPRFPHIDHVYLDRRENFMPTFDRKQDSLCKLSLKEKLRICLAVFKSPHFRRFVEYPSVPRIDRVDGSCLLKTVSFRSDSAKEEAAAKNRKYQEWMMSCKPISYWHDTSEERFDYFLSSAYTDNEIWVYSDQRRAWKEIQVEILATNIRISLDEEWIRKREPSKTDYDYAYELYEYEY